MKKVLITGASGFIGGACLPVLVAEGFEVVAITARSVPPLATGDGIRWAQVDLLDALAVERLLEAERPGHLIHAAWHPVRSGVMASPQNWIWLKAGLALVDAFARLGGERAGVIGSCAEYDWSYGVCRQGRTPYRPGSIYGSAKLALREALTVLNACRDVSIVWPRPFFAYGPGEHPSRLVASVTLALLEGREAETSHGRQIRDYMCVMDIAEGIVASLRSAHEGPVDLATGEARSVRDIVSEIGRQLGKEHLIRFGARGASADEPAVILGEREPARSLVGWQPKVTLEDGIARTIAHFSATKERR